VDLIATVSDAGNGGQVILTKAASEAGPVNSRYIYVRAQRIPVLVPYTLASQHPLPWPDHSFPDCLLMVYQCCSVPINTRRTSSLAWPLIFRMLAHSVPWTCTHWT
jgi:hypothetical protein